MVLLAAPARAAGDPLEEARVLNQQVVKLYQAGRYQDALPLAQRALEIREKALGPEHPDTAGSLNNLALLYQDMGAYDKALPLYQRALAIREKVLGPEDPLTAISLNNLAELYQDMGAYEKALPLYQRALAIKEKALGLEHPGTANSLDNLALLYKAMGAYDKALPLYQQALKTYEKALGPEHPDTANSLNNLAGLYDVMGAYDKALPLYQRALAIREKVLGPEHPDTANSLNNLASLYEDMGDYDQALPKLQWALKIREKALGPEHPLTASSLNNLAMLYEDMGAYKQALPLYQRALEIREKALGLEHPGTLNSLENLGYFYLAQKDYPAAERYFRRGKFTAGLVELSLARGQPAEALKLLQGHAPTWRDTLLYNVQYHTLQGLALAGVGRLGEAALALHQAVQAVEELRRRTPGQKTEFFQGGLYGGNIRPYRGLVSVLAEMARKHEALPPALKDYGPDAGAAAFYFAEDTKARVLLEAMAAAVLKQTPGPVSAAFYSAEDTKARVLPEAMAAEVQKQTPTEIRPDLHQREENLLNLQAALEAQWEKALVGGEEAVKEVQQKKARLNADLQALITELRQKYPLYAALHYPQPVPAAGLPLKDNEVLLEYALGEAASYVMVVRKGGVSKVVPIPLGQEALAGKVKDFMEPFINDDPKGFSLPQAKDLYDLLLGGVLPGVKENERVIIIPDGILGLLPFEALVLKEGKDLTDSVFVGDKHNLTYYQSAAVLALKRRLKEEPASQPLFALGDPLFTPQGGDFPVLTSEGRKEKFPPLEETQKEVQAIAGILGVKAAPPDVLLGLQANETFLKKSPLQDYRYLHFATHACLQKIQGIMEPFILLGQVGNQDGDNGFLTMSKVLGLKLRADMVVLSACDTGRGKVMEGEGVANFARAFQHAGAQSVVVSLWEVKSRVAVEYMTLFYRHLKEGKSRLEALQLARRAIKAQYPQPFFWAVFILHGEG